MKKWLGLMFLLALILAACSGGGEDSQAGEINVGKAYELYQNGTFFLDVRTVEEWNQIHAPNSTLIPLDQLPGRINELPDDELIIVVCRSGNRSEMGRDILLDSGFTQVTSMAGGLTEWVASGYPTTSGP